MQNRLAVRGRKMVTIIDPHIKRDGSYHVHSEASAKGLYIKNTDGTDFDGWCWPGSSSYLDFTAEHVREWWADQFALDKYQGSTLNLFTWNDMNEPSVFNGPEVSMAKDKLSLAGIEHREWHNLYGFYQQMATARGHVKRSGDTARPFVLSRAFAAGSQRVGAIWTGDNAAEWSHLEASVPMLLSINLAGLHFAGADVGGFFGNPDAELMTRWYQAGAYQPFFRAHAHIDAKRREPWLFGEATMLRLRSAVRERYALLPYWYTVYFASHTEGQPVMRPLWVEFPGDAALLTEQRSWMVGSDLLVAPVMTQGSTEVAVTFPGGAAVMWYDVRSFKATAGGSQLTVQAPIDSIPVYQRSGSIIPRQERPRRSSALMAKDPFTLTVAPDATGAAAGSLFLDDDLTFAYANGDYRHKGFAYSTQGSLSTLQCTHVSGGKRFAPSNTVERVRILGVQSVPSSVTATADDGSSSPVQFHFDAAANVLVLRQPAVKIAYNWTITVQW
jgi:alpha 1,3-glucosidase